MHKEKITIHSMITITGRKIKYARILKVQDSLIIGQSLLLHRLSKNQLIRAIDLM